MNQSILPTQKGLIIFHQYIYSQHYREGNAIKSTGKKVLGTFYLITGDETLLVGPVCGVSICLSVCPSVHLFILNFLHFKNINLLLRCGTRSVQFQVKSKQSKKLSLSLTQNAEGTTKQSPNIQLLRRSFNERF